MGSGVSLQLPSAPSVCSQEGKQTEWQPPYLLLSWQRNCWERKLLPDSLTEPELPGLSQFNPVYPSLSVWFRPAQMKKRPRFFTPAEVASHFTAGDLWVSFLGKVCDLTPLMKQHSGEFRLKVLDGCSGSNWAPGRAQTGCDGEPVALCEKIIK